MVRSSVVWLCRFSWSSAPPTWRLVISAAWPEEIRSTIRNGPTIAKRKTRITLWVSFMAGSIFLYLRKSAGLTP
ncbi:hypothetical protein D3C76_1667700 [compost metagenome]